MLQIAVSGAMGRMGRCILELAADDDRFDIAAALTRPDDPHIGKVLSCGDGEVVVADRLGVPCEVLIDVGSAEGTLAWLDVAERLQIPLVTGVTGHGAEALARLREGSRIVPVVVAPNFSVGMWAMVSTAAKLAVLLGDDYDIELVEAHHNKKSDAPSGSALALLRAIVGATGRSMEEDVVYGRHGQVGAKPGRQIGVHAVRMGDVVGRHDVHFSGAGETLTLSHQVQSRSTFASGALRAAVWAVDQPPGLYSMDDVLGQSVSDGNP